MDWRSKAAGALGYAAASAILLAAWMGGHAAEPRVIPSPLEAAAYAASNARVLARDALVTLTNTIAGFTVALLTAVALAGASSAWRPLRRVIEPFNVLVQSVSALVWSLLFLILFGFTSRLPAVGVAWAAAFPILLSASLKGFEHAGSQFGELAKILESPRVKAALYIYLPAATPYIVAASRSALGSALRISVVAEAFGSSGGIGYRLFVFYELHRYEGFFAWAAALLALMVTVDRLILAPLEGWARRWMGGG